MLNLLKCEKSGDGGQTSSEFPPAASASFRCPDSSCAPSADDGDDAAPAGSGGCEVPGGGPPGGHQWRFRRLFPEWPRPADGRQTPAQQLYLLVLTDSNVSLCALRPTLRRTWTWLADQVSLDFRTLQIRFSSRLHLISMSLWKEGGWFLRNLDLPLFFTELSQVLRTV